MLTWTEREDAQKNAPAAGKAVGANAAEAASLDGGRGNNRPADMLDNPAFSEPSPDAKTDESQSDLITTDQPEAEWLAAFPGARVHRGMPNGMRRAMHLSRALVRAADAGDYVLAERLMNAAIRSSAAGRQQ